MSTWCREPSPRGHRCERRAADNVTCILGDVLEHPLAEQGYDAIVSMTALHHVPLEEVLPVLARALRPGGVLARRRAAPVRSP